MKLKYSENTLFQFIFIICVAVPYLNNYELTFGVWFISVLLTLRKTYSKTILYQILAFVAIIAIAFLSSFLSEFSTYDFIRDITYLLKPILGILIGYQICRNYLTNPLKTVIYGGVSIAVLHLLIVVWSFLFLNVRDIHYLRLYAGYFSDFEIYALVIVIFNKRLGISLSKSFRTKAIVVIAVSSLFYLSRINFVQFVILAMAIKGYFVISRRSIIVLGSSLLAVLILYSAVLYINPKRNGSGMEAFLYKVKIAPTEPFKTKINKDDYKDFNDNYRSLENILTIRQNSDDWRKILFGKGLGSTVDLHTKVYLDNVELEYISILHNGFMTVYLKSGLLGVCLLIFSVLQLRKARYKFSDATSLNHLITGTIIFLFFSYWVFMGLYFKADTKSILLGLFIAMIDRMKFGDFLPASEIDSKSPK